MSTNAAFSCFVSTVGLVLPFILTDPFLADDVPGPPISNAQSAAVVWINQQAIRRNLVLSNPASATFTYIVSMADTRSPHLEEGYLEVTIGAGVFLTSAFVFHVTPHF